MNTPAKPPRNGLRSILIGLVCIAVLLTLISGGTLGFLLWRSAKSAGGGAPSPTFDVQFATKDYSGAEAVSMVLGEAGSEQGLMHLPDEPDGTTQVHILEGVPTRTLSLSGTRATLNFYFHIDPTFKQRDVRDVSITVEYLDPYAGTMGVHYDALEVPGVMDIEGGKSKRAYKEASRPITLAGSNVWQTATFTTRDAGFANRQNGGADFRIWAKTGTLYLRRIVVRRIERVMEEWPADHSRSNDVDIVMGEENPAEGLRHLHEQADGRTTITNMGDSICRHLNRSGRGNGFLYFTISPSFKVAGLTNALCEVEYYSATPVTIRLQYDAVEFGVHRPYKSVTMLGGRTIDYGGNAQFSRVPGSNRWRTAFFPLIDGVFANSQNGGADFRLEVNPPNLFVRRVFLTRETAESMPRR